MISLAKALRVIYCLFEFLTLQSSKARRQISR